MIREIVKGFFFRSFALHGDIHETVYIHQRLGFRDPITQIMCVACKNLSIVWSMHLVPGTNILLTIPSSLDFTIIPLITLSSSTIVAPTRLTSYFMLMTSSSPVPLMTYVNLSWASCLWVCYKWSGTAGLFYGYCSDTTCRRTIF